MSKETLAKAANSTDLGMVEGVVKDIDRVAAMAGGDELGGLLLRYRESDQPQWARRIVQLVGRRVADKHRVTPNEATRIAIAALREFHSPHCVACHGARVMVLDNLKIECESCHGSGKERFTDASRAEVIGKYNSLIDAAVATAHKVMANAAGALLAHAAGRLE